jgi:hypothetical protein
MGSLERRLEKLEEELIVDLIVGGLVKAEIQVMLRILEASEAIERGLYEKVVGIMTEAGYIEAGQSDGPA